MEWLPETEAIMNRQSDKIIAQYCFAVGRGRV